MVDLARAKGWERVSLTGTAEFQERAARAFVEAGIGLTDARLERTARDAIEADRQKAAREQVAREREALAAQARTVERVYTPSTDVVLGIRYLVEETADHVPYKDKHGEVMLFESEAQAFEFRKVVGGKYPIVRSAVERERPVEAARAPKAPEPTPAPARAPEEHSPDRSDLEARRQKLLDLVEVLSAGEVTNIEDVREAYLVAGYEAGYREGKGKVFQYPPGDLLEERQAVTQARKGWKERADRRGVPETRLQEPRQTESAPAPDEEAKKQAIRAAAKLGERWQYAWDNNSIGTRGAAAGRVSTLIEAERKKIEAGDSPLSVSEFNKAVSRGKQRGIER